MGDMGQKIDVLDLVINVMREHEKNLDELYNVQKELILALAKRIKELDKTVGRLCKCLE